MERVTIKKMADMTGLHINTIRKYADCGLIKSKRDFRGWRIFPEPMETVKQIKGMLNGNIQIKKK